MPALQARYSSTLVQALPSPALIPVSFWLAGARYPSHTGQEGAAPPPLTFPAGVLLVLVWGARVLQQHSDGVGQLQRGMGERWTPQVPCSGMSAL